MSSTAEAAVTSLIGSSFTGGASTSPAPASSSSSELEASKFEFDAEFQTRIAALACRDDGFVRSCGHLVKPEYFENVGEAAVVNLATEYFQKYNRVPGDMTIWKSIITDAVKAKKINREVFTQLSPALASILKSPVSDRAYIEEKVSEFARHQAVTQAIFDSLKLIERKEFGKLEANIRKAIEVGIKVDGDAYDYFERVAQRTEIRLDKASGKLPPRGITTGLPMFDDLLFHRGWGRKELATIMGGAKAGKTTALVGFAKAAALAGHNVLYITLEVASAIISDRFDATLSQTEIRALEKHIHDVKSKIDALKGRAGKLILHEFPPGTFTPNMLTAIIERYKAQGQTFDLVVVDYADIMAPNFRYNDPIENSKNIYIDLRAVAVQQDLAVLTATQTNREGFKSAVAKAEHVAEDFNKVRTVDLMISINITDEERSRGEARLYFAASRNQESGFTVFVKQNLATMTFIQSILRVE